MTDRASDATAIDLALRWPVQVLEEVLLAPWTVQKVRRSLTELPDKIDLLSEALTEVAATAVNLDHAVTGLTEDLSALPEMLERLLPELSRLVGGMDDRMQHVESMVSELGDALLNLMGAIPGVRRALRDPR